MEENTRKEKEAAEFISRTDALISAMGPEEYKEFEKWLKKESINGYTMYRSQGLESLFVKAYLRNYVELKVKI